MSEEMLASPPDQDLPAQNIGSAVAGSVPAYGTQPYDPERTRENFRGLIALLLLALMAGVVVASFALFWLHPDRVKDLKDFFALIFGPVVALVGAATGYYFGSQSANHD